MKIILMTITSDWVRGVSEKEISRQISKFLICATGRMSLSFTEEEKPRKGKHLGFKHKEVCNILNLRSLHCAPKVVI